VIDTTLNDNSAELLVTAGPNRTAVAAVPRALSVAVVLFATTAFMASGLLFVVEPMYARLVLPRLGGSPSVWNVCVLFFQTMLLLGYLYAHLSTKWLGVKRQAGWHALLLVLPLLFLPLGVSSEAPAAGQNPLWWLLQQMALTVGVPFFVLATSGPLLQRWFGAIPHPSSRDPYFLYAASNVGSLLALLGYPFLIEPALGLLNQSQLWTAGYLLFGSSVSICIWAVRRSAPRETANPVEPGAAASVPISIRQRLQWVVLSFAPSSLMLGVTAHISTDVAAVPLMWVLPLALYLLSFVVAFSRRGAARVTWWGTAAQPLVFACLVGIILNGNAWWVMPLHLVAFFVCALACHGRLADGRPPVAHLTAFYLWVSFGGMLGGVFNTLLAPQVFTTVLEYPLMLAFICALVPIRPRARGSRPVLLIGGYLVLVLCPVVWLWGNPSEAAARAILAVALGVLVPLATAHGVGAFRGCSLAALAVIVFGSPLSGAIPLFTGRSFFGVLRVMEAADHTHRILRHGSTMHGWQEIPADDRCEASSYYHPDGPVGDLIKSVGPRLHDVAVVGLGTGAMACYAAPGQRWTFYEIDSLVERVARDSTLFTHLKNGRGDVKIVIGDGRIMLREARSVQYDMIVLDAFSSDAIPVHLLTREAIQLYMSKLKEDGILAVHISNRYLRLEPLVAALAKEERLNPLVKSDGYVSGTARMQGRTAAQWMVLSRRPEAFARLADTGAWQQPESSLDHAWTDDYSNIFSALR
jgi:hypothetical protein